MILNPNKTKALVVSRSGLNPLHGDFVLSGVSIRASPNLDTFGVKFDSKLAFVALCMVLFPVSLKKFVF